MMDSASLSAPATGTRPAREPVLKVVNGAKVYGGVHAI